LVSDGSVWSYDYDELILEATGPLVSEISQGNVLAKKELFSGVSCRKISFPNI
jgi:hypothetical protein